MRISHTDRNNNKNLKIILVLFLLLSIMHYFLGYLYRPIVSNVYTKLYSNFFSTSATELQALQNKINILENENSSLQNLLRDASITEEFIREGRTQTIKSNIVFNKSTLLYSELLLDKGGRDGINKNSLVFVSGLYPIGYISEVYDDSALLKLFTTNNLETIGIMDLVKSTSSKIVFENKKDTESTSTNTTSEVTASSSLDTASQNNIDITTEKKVKKLITSTAEVKVIGDGAYGLNFNLPDNLKVEIGDIVKLKSNTNYEFAEVIAIDHNENEKVNIIKAKSYYNPKQGQVLYIEK